MGGNLAAASVQQISADMVKIGLQPGEKDDQTERCSGKSVGNVQAEEVASHFGVRHGPVLVLSDETTQATRESSSASSHGAP